VRVIEPVSLREKIEAELKRYLAPKGYDAWQLGHVPESIKASWEML
jgi:hypothetical protein